MEIIIPIRYFFISIWTFSRLEKNKNTEDTLNQNYELNGTKKSTKLTEG